VGASLAFTRTPEELDAEMGGGAPELAIVDLTAPGLDHAKFFDRLESAAPPVPVLGYTTHVLARETQPLHGRCARVVTKETLTRELGRILTEGIAA
jgi:CheY-like chemotaxis protein